MSLRDQLLQLDLETSRHGSPLSSFFKNNLDRRGNTPSGAYDQVLGPHLPQAQRQNKLWIVDRLLEPQTIAHFIEFTAHGQLPDGRQSTLPRLTADEMMLWQQSFSEWAPLPYSRYQGCPVERVVVHVGSFEDSTALVSISKELKTMKSRLWEKIMPLSERRWEELNLDSPAMFPLACQYFCSVTNLFHFLNMPTVKRKLRATFNSIYQKIKMFENALNAKKEGDGQPPIQITALWHKFIESLFSSIATESHDWIIRHITRLLDPILEGMANGQTVDSQGVSLSNKLHDLVENSAQADSAIFIPMDGYEGSGIHSQDNLIKPDMKNTYREQPISFSANTDHRKADYYCRVKYLTRVEGWSGSQPPLGGPAPPEAYLRAWSQVKAQQRARVELRGEPVSAGEDIWVTEAKRRITKQPDEFRWGYVAYRICHDHTDEEWDDFKAKFEADIAQWGPEKQGIEEIRQRSNVEWRDAKYLGLLDNSIEATRSHFASILKFDLEPKDRHDGVILAADKAVIESYIRPTPGQRGFVLAIDQHYDPSDEDPNRAAESPGYSGTLRILGSLLWDDLGAMMLRQTQFLGDLWVLAMDHPEKVYEGPLTWVLRS